MLAMGDSALRKEADTMTFVGCDLHTRMQQVAVLDTRTGEVSERQLAHDGRAIEEFYAALPEPVTIGIESTGYAVWFHTLMQRARTPQSQSRGRSQAARAPLHYAARSDRL